MRDEEMAVYVFAAYMAGVLMGALCCRCRPSRMPMAVAQPAYADSSTVTIYEVGPYDSARDSDSSEEV